MESLFLPQWGAFLRYHDLPGKSPTRVYLHGLAISSSSASFTNVAMHPDLAGHRSLLVDFLGFGFSDRPPDFSYTHEDQAYAIAGLLDHLDLQDCAFVGHSMGGSVAISLAALRPELVSRLIVAEGNLDPGGGLVTDGTSGDTYHPGQGVGAIERGGRSTDNFDTFDVV